MLRAAAASVRLKHTPACARAALSTNRTLWDAKKGSSSDVDTNPELASLLDSMVQHAKSVPQTPSSTAEQPQGEILEAAPLPLPEQSRGGLQLSDGADGLGIIHSLAPMGPDLTAFGRTGTYMSSVRKENWTFYVNAGRNNTIVTIADSNGRLPKKGWTSAGIQGFKGANRASPEAGYRCAVFAFNKFNIEIDRLQKQNPPIDMEITLQLSGYGPGRDSIYRALLMAEGAEVQHRIRLLVDATPIKIGGTRAKKARRL
ncbi:hypothetical protein BKA62DRAFT_698303 [Auriculariales sp. MPI-PUGE-AT-0066]|nr:hypothetical protein BKA62DRAFT_698303 [Auriculariales sp. MPI-PUGE-AT-0066]